MDLLTAFLLWGTIPFILYNLKVQPQLTYHHLAIFLTFMLACVLPPYCLSLMKVATPMQLMVIRLVLTGFAFVWIGGVVPITIGAKLTKTTSGIGAAAAVIFFVLSFFVVPDFLRI